MNIQQSDIFIVSYPKSGSTLLRFLLAAIFWPQIDHDFDTIHGLTPSWDTQEMQLWKINTTPRIFKSHNFTRGDFPNVIYIHRHVGDILISFWHHLKKFENDKRSLDDFIVKTEYGSDWRKHIDYWVENADIIIGYNDLINNELCANRLSEIVQYIFDKNNMTLNYELLDSVIKSAISRSSFEKVQTIEMTKGIGSLYQNSDPNIMFVRDGKPGQYNSLERGIIDEILDRNDSQLRKLKYK